jgi:hypothetical protein
MSPKLLGEGSISLDAADALSELMRDGRPDAGRVARSSPISIARRCRGGSRLLSARCRPCLPDANPNPAIQLERLWSDLTRGLPFLTVCTYRWSASARRHAQRSFERVRRARGGLPHHG